MLLSENLLFGSLVAKSWFDKMCRGAHISHISCVCATQASVGTRQTVKFDAFGFVSPYSITQQSSLLLDKRPTTTLLFYIYKR